MDDIQNTFKETIAKFMENGFDAELGYSKYDYRNKNTENSQNGHSGRTLRTSFSNVDVAVSGDKGEQLSRSL